MEYFYSVVLVLLHKWRIRVLPPPQLLCFILIRKWQKRTLISTEVSQVECLFIYCECWCFNVSVVFVLAGRQVKMAFVNSVAKPPRDVRRRQERFGTTSGLSTAASTTAAAPIKSVSHPAYCHILAFMFMTWNWWWRDRINTEDTDTLHKCGFSECLYFIRGVNLSLIQLHMKHFITDFEIFGHYTNLNFSVGGLLSYLPDLLTIYINIDML